MCPACVIPIGIGIFSLCHFFGFTNLICGIWIGYFAFLISWGIDWFLRKIKWNFPYQKIIIPILILIIITLILK